MKNNHFKSLQYNIRNQKNAIMIFLLTNARIKDFDVLAIQKFGRNFYVNTTYNFFDNQFGLAHQVEKKMKICFYINKNINSETWETNYSSNDMCTLKLKTRMKSKEVVIHIHNVYSFSSVSLRNVDDSSTISKLREALKTFEEHLMVGDFNLHHPYWESSGVRRQHVMAEVLLETMETRTFISTLSKRIVIWQKHNQSSTIHLMFMTKKLCEAMIVCDVEKKLNQFSDHLLIVTCFQLKIDGTFMTPRKSGKIMNVEKMKSNFFFASGSKRLLNIKEKVNRYVNEMIEAFNQTMNAEIFGIKFSQFAKFFGNEDCEEVIKKTRRARRIGINIHTEDNRIVYDEVCKRKRKTIAKTKKDDFRKSMREITESSEKI